MAKRKSGRRLSVSMGYSGFYWPGVLYTGYILRRSSRRSSTRFRPVLHRVVDADPLAIVFPMEAQGSLTTLMSSTLSPSLWLDWMLLLTSLGLLRSNRWLDKKEQQVKVETRHHLNLFHGIRD